MIKFDMNEFLQEFEEAFKQVKSFNMQSRYLQNDMDNPNVQLYRVDVIGEKYRKTSEYLGMNSEIIDGIRRIGYFTFEDCFSWAIYCMLAGAVSAACALYEYGFSRCPRSLAEGRYRNTYSNASDIFKLVENFWYWELVNWKIKGYNASLNNGLNTSYEITIMPNELDCWLTQEEREEVRKKRKT